MPELSIKLDRREFMQLVYVLNKDGLPLMPTHKLGKVRHLLKGGKKKLNQAPYTVKTFRLLFDKVKYQNQECFIFGRRSSGYFDIRMLDGTKVNNSVSYKKLELLEARENYLKEERSRQFLPLIN